jgi:hypothetical protein
MSVPVVVRVILTRGFPAGPSVAEDSTSDLTLPAHASVRWRDRRMHWRAAPSRRDAQASELTNIFRPFYRVADARDRETGGGDSGWQSPNGLLGCTAEVSAQKTVPVVVSKS